MSEAVRQHYTLATTGHLKHGGSVKHEAHGHRPQHEMHESYGYTPNYLKCGGKAFKEGGHVTSDEKQDRALVKKMVKKDALSGKKKGGKC